MPGEVIFRVGNYKCSILLAQLVECPKGYTTGYVQMFCFFSLYVFWRYIWCIGWNSTVKCPVGNAIQSSYISIQGSHFECNSEILGPPLICSADNTQQLLILKYIAWKIDDNKGVMMLYCWSRLTHSWTGYQGY